MERGREAWTLLRRLDYERNHMTNPFPQDFLWGVATAGHQVEGNNVNSDTWFLEQLPGTIFAEPSGDAVDHYHRYREDIALIAGLGFTSYRFSLEVGTH